MNSFDWTILQFVSGWTHHYYILDKLIAFTQYNYLIAGAFPMALFWWAWFREDKRHPQDREHLLFGLGICVLALALARGLALTLPFRERPLDNPLLHFQLPYGVNSTVLEGWSSFPSDHATLFFCLATILWMVSRPLGIVAVLHALFIATLPRIYMGLHYPTDIVAGAMLGYAMGSVSRIGTLRASFARPVLRWGEHHLAWFYALLFLVSYEFAELFDTVRFMLRAIKRI